MFNRKLKLALALALALTLLGQAALGAGFTMSPRGSSMEAVVNATSGDAVITVTPDRATVTSITTAAIDGSVTLIDKQEGLTLGDGTNSMFDGEEGLKVTSLSVQSTDITIANQAFMNSNLKQLFLKCDSIFFDTHCFDGAPKGMVITLSKITSADSIVLNSYEDTDPETGETVTLFAFSGFDTKGMSIYVSPETTDEDLEAIVQKFRDAGFEGTVAREIPEAEDDSAGSRVTMADGIVTGIGTISAKGVVSVVGGKDEAVTLGDGQTGICDDEDSPNVTQLNVTGGSVRISAKVLENSNVTELNINSGTVEFAENCLSGSKENLTIRLSGITSASQLIISENAFDKQGSFNTTLILGPETTEEALKEIREKLYSYGFSGNVLVQPADKKLESDQQPEADAQP